eukprot:2287973-Pyramimonas_sp.AAC.1
MPRSVRCVATSSAGPFGTAQHFAQHSTMNVGTVATRTYISEEEKRQVMDGHMDGGQKDHGCLEETRGRWM